MGRLFGLSRKLLGSIYKVLKCYFNAFGGHNAPPQGHINLGGHFGPTRGDKRPVSGHFRPTVGHFGSKGGSCGTFKVTLVLWTVPWNSWEAI